MLTNLPSITKISRKIFDNPATWKTSSITGKDKIAINLTSCHIEAFESALINCKKKAGSSLEKIGRNDFRLPTIAEDIRGWQHQIEHGCGMLILRGFPVERFEPKEIEQLWFGLGTFFGRAVSQSVMGDLVGHVVDVAGPDSRHRAYRNSSELQLHTDRCDTVGMLCLQKAWKGGVSGYTSALSVHNEMLETRPELLAPLWRGFHLHLFGEQPLGELPYSPVRIPVFSEKDGVTTVVLLRGYIDMAANEFGLPVSDLEWDALDTFDEIANRPEFRFDFTLERGEAIFFNNNVILHRRSAFEDHANPDKKRHLMRLWLMDWAGRSIHKAVGAHKGVGGIRPQEGRMPYYGNQ